VSELYHSKEPLDADGGGAADALHETFAQLDELLVGSRRRRDRRSSRAGSQGCE